MEALPPRYGDVQLTWCPFSSPVLQLCQGTYPRRYSTETSCRSSQPGRRAPLPAALLRALGGLGQFLVQGLDGLVVNVRVGFAAVRGDVEEAWCVCHVRSLVPATTLHERRLGFVVSALNARGNRLPGATTARWGLTPTAPAFRRGRVRM